MTHSLPRQLRQRLQATPPAQTEDSILLRVLVQGLVIVAIVAVDIAAQTQTSLWAVPLSIVGATWSWYRRKERNIAVKFGLALGMLGMLFAFFGNVLANLNDTRLVLAQLLIQLQVLHSFDLPRRKDLGYSMVIGLILLGVAGTVSQSSGFAVVLLLFLAIALPTLILDYRSRLGLTPALERRQFKLPLSPGRLGSILLIVILLGLAIFALMPRFPGYRLQTFPVSSPIELEHQNFEGPNRGIVNPGYGQEQEKSGGGGTSSQSQQPGAVDPTFYYGFNNQMNQNLRGQMKRQLVMRVRSQAPGFWRVLAFDHYTGQGWTAREDQLVDIERPSWSYRFTLTPLPTAKKTKQIVQSYTILSEFPNLIPALAYPKYLFFPTQEVALDPEGSLRSPLGLMPGLTYTVVSEVPDRDRTLLGQASQNYPERIKNDYLQVPPAIAASVRQQAQELLARSEPLDSPYEQALFLAQALKQNYTIQPDLPSFAPDEDLVKAFLRAQGGYPDHFSTVLTVMLRSLGIPARLAVGFAPGQFNPFTGYYVVHNTDAYALTEVYFPEYGWFTFDPIPGHELIPPSFAQSQTFGVLRQIWHWVAGWLPSPVAGWLNFIGRELGRLWRWFSGSALGLFAGLIIVVALGFLGWLGWQGAKSLKKRRRLAGLPPMDRLYQQMLSRLNQQGYPKHPAQTPLEYANRVCQHHPAAAESVAAISQAYVDWRYGERSPDLNALQQQFKRLAEQLNSSRTSRQDGSVITILKSKTNEKLGGKG